MKKPASAKQIAANRRNAQQSTGPRTAEGRAVSRMNALRHGILSREVLVRSGVLRESAGELEAVQRRFWEDLRPAGALEEMLVEQIVTAYWRLRRALRAESAEIARHAGPGEKSQLNEPELEVEQRSWIDTGDVVRAMEESALGNALLADRLRGMRAAVEAKGAVTEGPMLPLIDLCFGQDNRLLRALNQFHRRLAADPNRRDPTVRARHKEEALAFLDREIELCQGREERLRQVEREQGWQRHASEGLPSAEMLNRLLRYETKLERQMERAMVQLERWQRMRREEDKEEVPAGAPWPERTEDARDEAMADEGSDQFAAVEVPVEEPVDDPAEIPAAIATEVPEETPTESPEETPAEMPEEVSEEVQAESGSVDLTEYPDPSTPGYYDRWIPVQGPAVAPFLGYIRVAPDPEPAEPARPAKPVRKRAKAKPKQAADSPAPTAANVGRNEPCPCQSGRKFKRCCGAIG